MLQIENLKQKLSQYHANYLIRKQYVVQHRTAKTIIIDNKQLINFAGNDYLAVTDDSQVKRAFIDGVNKYGFGSSGSALISGYHKPHQLLEEKFAEFLNRKQAILFNSGYHANLGVISTLATRDSTIILDKLCHASILDGVKLSQAKCLRYQHQNLLKLQSRLIKNEGQKFVITEGVFSMDGDITPLDKLLPLVRKHQAFLIVDDAHGIGILGKNGGGTAQHFNLTTKDIPCLIVPLGKAFGSQGAIIAGDEDLITSLRQFARSYIYSTAYPPAVAYATITALNIISQENWRQQKLNSLIEFFIKEAKIRNLPLISEHLTPIKPIITGSNHNTVNIQAQLIEKGFFVSCIRPPTVPVGTARIRISLNCMHEKKDIINLLDLLAEYI